LTYCAYKRTAQQHDVLVGGNKTGITSTNNVQSPLAESLKLKRTRRKIDNTGPTTSVETTGFY